MINAPDDIADGAYPREMWESIVDWTAPDLPKMEHVKVYVTAAQQATLFSSPVALVAGVGRKIIYPEYTHMRKLAGTAWTTAGSGSLQLGWTTSLNAQIMAGQTYTTNFFGAAEAVWVVSGSVVNGTGSIGVDTVNTSGVTGAPLRLKLGSADISGGTGTLICNVWYRLWDGI